MPDVAINALPLDFPHSGTAVYVESLGRYLPAAAPDVRCRYYLRAARAPAEIKNFRRIPPALALLNRGSAVAARLDKLTWETVAFPLACALDGAQLIHYPYLAAPPISHVPVICTVHDVIPLVLPSYHRSRQAAAYSRLMEWAVKRCAAIITVSNYSRQDIIGRLRIPERKIHVTFEAVDQRFSPAVVSGERERIGVRYRLPEAFVLYAGGAERRKNIETLVRAWALISASMRRRNTHLVIVARFPPADSLYPDIPGLATELGIAGQVQFVSEIDECDKPAVYRASSLFCFPSRYEGFGFTPLEAMASGVATIVSNAASLPEVVGDGALQLPPDDTASWAEAIVQLSEPSAEKSRLIRRGLEQAGRFSWERCADETARVYRQVLAT